MLCMAVSPYHGERRLCTIKKKKLYAPRLSTTRTARLLCGRCDRKKRVRNLVLAQLNDWSLERLGSGWTVSEHNVGWLMATELRLVSARLSRPTHRPVPASYLSHETYEASWPCSTTNEAT